VWDGTKLSTNGQGDKMAKQYDHYTVAVRPEEADEFEQKLQKIKDHYGIESTSTIFKILINGWAELHWKAQKYDQIKDMILGFEAYYKYKKGELVHVERDGRSTF